MKNKYFDTIDDAPTSESTPQTLEILKYYNVKATFLHWKKHSRKSKYF